MIQRIQSLYLFLASLFYFIYWFFGYQWYEKGFGFFVQSISLNSNFFTSDFLFNITSFIPLSISILSLFTIFFFKNRLIQIRFNQFLVYLSFLMFLYSSYYFSISFFYLLNIIDSKLIEFFLYAAILNPLICFYLLYSSLKKIKQDENLIKSINRLR
ncbi:MAG: hypothetical protein CMP65_00765 [Flavobacteriales bacterium]|nr:hypothetical protein [Flavobacteriales bacterium]